MPGFIAGVYVSPKDKVGAAALTNSGTARLGRLIQALIARSIDAVPVDPEPWRVEDEPPEEIGSALGRWWLEGAEVVFRWRKGRLEAQHADAEDWEQPAVFEPEEHDRWRTVSGPEHGEQLRLERDADGRVVRMYWATYLVTREPVPFGAG
jgi:hypothetical protein